MRLRCCTACAALLAIALSPLVLAVAGLTLVSPSLVDDVSFQLSVAATAGIVLWATPLAEAVEMGGFKATLQEPPIPGDSTSRETQPALPAYLAYQGDGDVTAPLVYVNYGTEEDYRQLARLGVSVKGRIVIARYGQVWRGVKPLLAYQHGAIGCLIYSDPADDGYAQEAVYPDGPARPPRGIQRGSVMDMTLYPGDPLTPGVAATRRRQWPATSCRLATIAARALASRPAISTSSCRTASPPGSSSSMRPPPVSRAAPL